MVGLAGGHVPHTQMFEPPEGISVEDLLNAAKGADEELKAMPGGWKSYKYSVRERKHRTPKQK